MFLKKFIQSHKKLAEIVEKLKKDNKKIVFTNGCFDLIHPGHVEYLEKAKKLGDVLVVALNSDASIKRLKGEKRPILNEIDRVKIISSFYFVDYVTIFNEDTPYNLIKILLPDILVKGGDWDINKIVGKEIVEKNGGKVLNIEFKEGYSTSGIIETILSRWADGD